MADIILLGWPQKTGFLDKIFGEKVEYIMGSTDKNLFVTYFQKPLIVSKRIVVISPPLSEVEKGFEVWLKKLARFCSALSIPMVHYGNTRSHEAMYKWMKITGSRLQIHPRTLPDLDDLLILGREISEEDLLIFTTARKGSVSWSNVLDTIPQKLEKHFPKNNKMIIYPQQHEYIHTAEGMDEIYSGTLTKGLETIGKGLENIFKKPKEE